MIRRQEECRVQENMNMRGGDGMVKVTHFINSDSELNDKGRLFAKLNIEPGSGIGYHMHDNDSELIYVITGVLEYVDGDEPTILRPGDVAICPPHTGHSLKNIGTEIAELIAVIPYE